LIFRNGFCFVENPKGGGAPRHPWRAFSCSVFWRSSGGEKVSSGLEFGTRGHLEIRSRPGVGLPFSAQSRVRSFSLLEAILPMDFSLFRRSPSRGGHSFSCHQSSRIVGVSPALQCHQASDKLVDRLQQLREESGFHLDPLRSSSSLTFGCKYDFRRSPPKAVFDP